MLYKVIRSWGAFSNRNDFMNNEQLPGGATRLFNPLNIKSMLVRF